MLGVKSVLSPLDNSSNIFQSWFTQTSDGGYHRKSFGKETQQTLQNSPQLHV